MVLRQSIPKILEGLKLTTDRHLKNAVAVLFAKELFPAYSQCHLKMARFKGLNRQEFLDENQLYGNVFTQLENAMLFVRRHLPVAARIEPGKLQRVETPLVPYDAIREVLINALCHRDYNARDGSLALAIYDDRMEISNHGGLLPGLTMEKIKAGFSSPRNKLIADVFYSCKMIERWGRGVPGIISSCLDVHDPEPEFVSDSVEFKVIFRFSTSLRPPTVHRGERIDTLSNLTERQRKIVEILAKGSVLTSHDIFSRLHGQASLRTIKADWAHLKSLSLIDTVGKSRNTLWKFKK